MNRSPNSNCLRVSGALLLAIFISTSTALSGSWTPPATLGAQKASWVATAGADQNGNAVAAWLQTDTIPYKVYASLRKAGTTKFTAAVGISGAGTWNPPVARSG